MKTISTFLILFFISFNLFAQDKKFSVEVNYPITISNGFDNLSGIVDVGLKYRFAKGELFNYGASLTFDYLKDNGSFNNQAIDRNYFFFHVNGFTEMTIPSAQKIHPFVGVGFTLISYEGLSYINFDDDFGFIEKRKELDPGFNLQLGIQYDFTSTFFMQSYFHYIRTFSKSDFNDETFGINYNQIKFGLGFRF